MVLEAQRIWVNSHAKRLGSKITPQVVKDKFNGDLGDFLTADIDTLPRACAAIGGVTPGYLIYRVHPVAVRMSGEIYNDLDVVTSLKTLAVAASVYVNPVTIPLVMMYAGLGWAAGRVIETALKRNPSRIRN
tara:strand:+ start:265 stop:660 length:396 start_codon:yes stop_codon:yes gene_type:complete